VRHASIPERAADRAALVERTLERIGGGVHVGELVYHTGLSDGQVLGALRVLEREGRAVPFTWTVPVTSGSEQ
jgi:hypothetical protein